MAICRKCRKPLHPFSRYAMLGIGPECLRKENPEVSEFLDKMNINVPQKDLDYANDLNSAKSVDIKNLSNLSDIFQEEPNIEKLLSKTTKKLFFSENEMDAFNERYPREINSTANITDALIESSKEDLNKALELSKEILGRDNEKIRRKGLKKYLKEAKQETK